jgi:hypothetical protein
MINKTVNAVGANSIFVQLYAEPKSLRHTHEIKYYRESNSDINLIDLAQSLQVEGTVHVSDLP